MKILLAEDEVQLSNAEATFLKLKGFDVDAAYNGQEAVDLARANAYDVIVLDIMMPQKDGIEALREIRAQGNTTPVIMLTAKSEVDDRIDGLSAGADDYLTKPFALRELEARLRAQVRRTEQYSAEVLSYRSLTLNAGEAELSCHSAVRLARKETRLMEFLIRNAERSVSAEEIFRHVWREQAELNVDTVYLYVSYLRQKMKAIGCDVEIRGGNEGYVLCGVEA
ncbi:MAG: response regulator transcription factor [Oscillospiraceae bacterium]|nr:response regulator transcription factor [Oscillospiraceae bacterium]